MLSKRIKKLNNSENYSGDYTVYIMSRDQRVEFNHALIAAQEFSRKYDKPLIVFFNAYNKLSVRNDQQFEFMYEGLYEVVRDLNKLNIPFVLKHGVLKENTEFIKKQLNPTAIFFDFSPLRNSKKDKNEFLKNVDYPVFEVDTHNIVPVWEASEKLEFAAYTIRPKINKRLDLYLELPKQLDKQDKLHLKFKDCFIFNDIDQNNDAQWKKVLNEIKAEKLENYKISFKGGYSNAKKVLAEFINDRLDSYSENRNDPNLDGVSNLSPYLHFGQISALEIALTVKNSGKSIDSINAFLEELIIRKELSDNYCFYNENYDNFKGAHEWAQKTLNEHRGDERDFVYTKKEFEQAKTHDKAWNAAQIQMMTTGKMHGYMRMYWAKKILEWTSSPEEAIKIAIYLNDKYSIDGLDPNGYTGIMWSICGVHDRAWTERPVFGKIRFMNFNGLKRKFDIENYIKRWNLEE